MRRNFNKIVSKFSILTHFVEIQWFSLNFDSSFPGWFLWKIVIFNTIFHKKLYYVQFFNKKFYYVEFFIKDFKKLPPQVVVFWNPWFLKINLRLIFKNQCFESTPSIEGVDSKHSEKSVTTLHFFHMANLTT